MEIKHVAPMEPFAHVRLCYKQGAPNGAKGNRILDLEIIKLT